MASWRVVLPAIIVVGLALTACAPEAPTDAATSAPPTEAPTETPEPAATETTPAATFMQPADCFEVVSDERFTALEDQGLELLGGPGGLYGDEYLVDPTPEESAGGITCIWGSPDTLIGEVTISVAPVSTSTRSAIVADLLRQGLNEEVLEGAILYAQLGDEEASPAIVNVVRTDSWISIIEAQGGEAKFEDAISLADEVYGQVYEL